MSAKKPVEAKAETPAVDTEALLAAWHNAATRFAGGGCTRVEVEQAKAAYDAASAEHTGK